MQQRRLRPGDVLDDYCPRERRITDHAIVAMIDDEIKQTRCVSCDAEHEYKQAKVPPQRRKKAPPALFTQVLDGLHGVEGPARLAPNAGTPAMPDEDIDVDVSGIAPPDPPTSQPTEVTSDEAPADAAQDTADGSEPVRDTDRPTEEGPVRRPLIRAQLPRPEGQPPPARDLPDFTIRQPSSSRGHRPGGHGSRGRRRGGGQQQGQGGGLRFGNQGRSNQFGRSGEHQHGGGRRGQGQGQGHGHGGRPNRGGRRGGGGKKH